MSEPTKAQIEAARKLLRNSSCFSDEVCSLLPCKCIEEALTAAAEVAGQDLRAEIERLRAALVLFIQTVNPPYPQSMALWQEHLKAATENAKAALATAAEVGRDPDIVLEGTKEGMDLFRKIERNATIERCAQVAHDWLKHHGYEIEGIECAAAIRALKDQP